MSELKPDDANFQTKVIRVSQQGIHYPDWHIENRTIEIFPKIEFGGFVCTPISKILNINAVDFLLPPSFGNFMYLTNTPISGDGSILVD